jgi:hypothetical protein
VFLLLLLLDCLAFLELLGVKLILFLLVLGVQLGVRRRWNDGPWRRRGLVGMDCRGNRRPIARSRLRSVVRVYWTIHGAVGRTIGGLSRGRSYRLRFNWLRLHWLGGVGWHWPVGGAVGRTRGIGRHCLRSVGRWRGTIRLRRLPILGLPRPVRLCRFWRGGNGLWSGGRRDLYRSYHAGGDRLYLLHLGD